MVTDAAGNTYVAGNFQASLTLAAGTVLTPQGQQDGYVAKYGPSGILLWTRQLTSPARADVVGIALDAAGNVCLAGNFFTSLQVGTRTLNIGTGAALYLARLDPQGQPLWLYQTSMNRAGAQSMGLDAAGNFYVGGTLGGTVTVDGITLAAPNAVAVCLIKFDAQGVAQWGRLGGNVPLIPNGPAVMTYWHSLTVAPAGDCYLSWTMNPGAAGFDALPLPAGYGDFDVALVKYDAQGTARWMRRYGSTLLDYAGTTTLDGSGHLLATMRFAGSFAGGPANLGTQTLTGTGLHFGTLLQLDAATGTLNWARTLNSDYTASYVGVVTDAAGNSYVAGSLTGTATLGSQQFGSISGTESDALVVSYSPQGTFRWAQQSGSLLAEGADHISLDGTGHLTVAGFFYGQGRFGSTTLAGPPVGTPASGFVARLGSVTTATPAARPLALGFYPNPAADFLHLPALPAGTAVQLIDALGRVAREAPVSAGGQVAVRGLAPGLYTLRATDAQGRQHAGKVIVE